MTEQNEIFLQNNLHHFLTLERAFYLRGLNVHERDGMERVMDEEFSKGYRCDKTCPDCVANMVRLLYRSYYNYLAAKHKDSTIYSTLSEGIEQMMNREPEPLIVHASFPLNLPDIKDLQFFELDKNIDDFKKISDAFKNFYSQEL